ncbi:MAG: HU family DNA-binding protein [Candidatus Neomarinimicrobiota bacterium]
MADKITFQELVDEFSEKSGETKAFSNIFIKDIFTSVQEGLRKDENVNIKGLGIFKLQEVNEREIINPKTGEATLIEAHKKIVYRPEKALRERVNEKYAHLEPEVLGKKEEVKEVKKEETIKNVPASAEKASSEQSVSDSDVESKKSIKIIYGEEDLPTYDAAKKVNPLLADKPLDEEEPPSLSDEDKSKNNSDNSKLNKKSPTFIIEKKKKPSPWRWIFPLLLILLIIGVIYFVPSGSLKLANFTSTKSSQNFSLIEKIKAKLAENLPEKKITALPMDTKLEKTPPVKEEKTVEVISSMDKIKIITQASEDENALIHIVQEGNTLWGLSDQYYQRYSLWPNIYRKNLEAISTPDFLPVGIELCIPELSGDPYKLTKADSARIAQGYYLVYTAYKKYDDKKANDYLKMAKRFRTVLE